MSRDYGKKFETIFKADFERIENATIDRLYDPGFGMRGIKNICDFIGYKYPFIVYAECKSKKGNTFPLQNLSQYNKLIAKKNVKGAKVGVVLWFIDHDIVLWIPITTFEKLFADNKKSFNVKMVQEKEYPCIIIPTIKSRTFLHGDYSVILKEKENE